MDLTRELGVDGLVEDVLQRRQELRATKIGVQVEHVRRRLGQTKPRCEKM